jgi:hypothetical protein
MRLLMLVLVWLLLAGPAAAERVVTDSAGREVTVPDRTIGWPRALRAEELPYIAPEFRDLPEIGRLSNAVAIRAVRNIPIPPCPSANSLGTSDAAFMSTGFVIFR